LVDGTSDEPLPVFPKSQDQLRRIRDSIRSNIIFQNLDEEQENGALNAMREVKVQKGEVIIRQGDVGEYFYVVETGLFNCYIRPPPLPSDWGRDESSRTEPLLTPFSQFSGTTKDPKFGFHADYGTKVAECPDGSSFGELALMYGHPRAASVIALEASTVWALDRMTFRTIILKAAHRRRTMYEQFLSAVPLLSSLGPAEKSKIADALVSKVYQDGEAVVRQGEQGDAFFFVEEGEATVTKLQETDGQLKEVTVGHYHVGDYFGGLVFNSLKHAGN
jgi:cAMP-dependent protein kinase regulator